MTVFFLVLQDMQDVFLKTQQGVSLFMGERGRAETYGNILHGQNFRFICE